MESEKNEMPDLDMLVNAKEALSMRDASDMSAVPTTAPIGFLHIKKYISHHAVIIIGVMVTTAIVAFLGYRFYVSYNSPEAQLLRAERENKMMVERVRSLILLPEGVAPIIYTIEDPAILIKEQSFFIGSERGDKLLLYPNIAKAVIYSPLRNLIVNAGPVEFGISNIHKGN